MLNSLLNHMLNLPNPMPKGCSPNPYNPVSSEGAHSRRCATSADAFARPRSRASQLGRRHDEWTGRAAKGRERASCGHARVSRYERCLASVHRSALRLHRPMVNDRGCPFSLAKCSIQCARHRCWEVSGKAQHRRTSRRYRLTPAVRTGGWGPGGETGFVRAISHVLIRFRGLPLKIRVGSAVSALRPWKSCGPFVVQRMAIVRR